ncbi:hypothetical protein HDV00_002170 [Rhizophlyctis rosea]|nr:hypothetical protein HDV00_002170 [Rhizophlyctis rosea]
MPSNTSQPPPHPSRPPTLTSLPPELLHQITIQTSLFDILRLSLTSKPLRTLLKTPTFGKEFLARDAHNLHIDLTIPAYIEPYDEFDLGSYGVEYDTSFYAVTLHTLPLHKLRSSIHPAFPHLLPLLPTTNRLPPQTKNPKARARPTPPPRGNPSDDPTSLLATFHQILLTSSHLLLQTGLHPPHAPKLDFFLMHLLTSSISLRQILPYLSPHQAQTLIHAHVSVSIMHYVARGRPALSPDALKEYKPSERSKAGWDAVIRMAVEVGDLHVPKCVRALKVLLEEGTEAGFVSNDEAEPILKGVQVIVDRFAVHGGAWYFEGVGYKEAWEGGEVEREKGGERVGWERWVE